MVDGCCCCCCCVVLAPSAGKVSSYDLGFAWVVCAGVEFPVARKWLHDSRIAFKIERLVLARLRHRTLDTAWQDKR